MDSQEKLPAKNEDRLSRTTTAKIKEQVVEKILDMERTADIKRWLNEEYGCKPSSQEYYMACAHKIIKEHHKPRIPTIINSHIRKYENIARKNEDSDPRVSILALQAIEKVLHITGSGIIGDNLTVNQQINIFEGIDTEELNELLKRINQKNDDDEIIEITDDE